MSAPLSDGVALLRYAAANGFLGAALVGLARTALSRYRRLRNELGIARYTEADFLDRLRAAGFAGERLAAQCRAQSGAHDLPGAAGSRLTVS